MLRSDDRDAAGRRSRGFSHQKFNHLWDENRLTGTLWQPLLGTNNLPWDVYFMYGGDAKWGTEPTAPDFWISTLSQSTKARFELKLVQLMDALR